MHTTFCFYLIDFLLNTDSHSKFCFFFFFFFFFFTLKTTYLVTQISVSQENAFEKSKNPIFFPFKTMGSNWLKTILDF